MLIEKLKEALVKPPYGGICCIIRENCDSFIEGRKAQQAMLDIITKLGYFSGVDSHPIACPVNKDRRKIVGKSVQAYLEACYSCTLYSTKSAYGRRRRKVLKELIKCLESTSKKQTSSQD